MNVDTTAMEDLKERLEIVRMIYMRTNPVSAHRQFTWNTTQMEGDVLPERQFESKDAILQG